MVSDGGTLDVVAHGVEGVPVGVEVVHGGPCATELESLMELFSNAYNKSAAPDDSPRRHTDITSGDTLTSTLVNNLLQCLFSVNMRLDRRRVHSYVQYPHNLHYSRLVTIISLSGPHRPGRHTVRTAYAARGPGLRERRSDRFARRKRD